MIIHNYYLVTTLLSSSIGTWNDYFPSAQSPFPFRFQIPLRRILYLYFLQGLYATAFVYPLYKSWLHVYTLTYKWDDNWDINLLTGDTDIIYYYICWLFTAYSIVTSIERSFNHPVIIICQISPFQTRYRFLCGSGSICRRDIFNLYNCIFGILLRPFFNYYGLSLAIFFR